MKSWEVLREAADVVGVKMLAGRLNLSTALVYKWCQETSKQDPDSSGARNPLDRLKEIYDVTQDQRVINWMCHEARGFYVPNPDVDPGETENLISKRSEKAKELLIVLRQWRRSVDAKMPTPS